MRIAVIGAGGCFAQNFVRICAEEGIETFGIGRSGPKSAPFWLVPKDFRFWELHLVTQLKEIMGVLDEIKPEIVVNFAAQGEGAASFGDTAPDYFLTNTVGLIRFILALRSTAYIKRFIHIGSSEVYGSIKEPADESYPLWPTSPYSISKAAFDQYLEVMHRTAKFPMNIVRPSNCYVEGQQLHRIIPKTIVTARKGERLKLHGGGMAVKMYMHADDLSQAILTVLRKGAVGEIYNVGPTVPMAIRGVVTMILRLLDIPWGSVIDEVDDRVGQDAKYHLNTDKIRALGWDDKVKLFPGLQRMINWVDAYPELLTMPTEYVHRA